METHAFTSSHPHARIARLIFNSPNHTTILNEVTACCSTQFLKISTSLETSKIRFELYSHDLTKSPLLLGGHPTSLKLLQTSPELSSILDALTAGRNIEEMDPLLKSTYTEGTRVGTVLEMISKHNSYFVYQKHTTQETETQEDRHLIFTGPDDAIEVFAKHLEQALLSLQQTMKFIDF